MRKIIIGLLLVLNLAVIGVLVRWAYNRKHVEDFPIAAKPAPEYGWVSVRSERFETRENARVYLKEFSGESVRLELRSELNLHGIGAVAGQRIGFEPEGSAPRWVDRNVPMSCEVNAPGKLITTECVLPKHDAVLLVEDERSGTFIKAFGRAALTGSLLSIASAVGKDLKANPVTLEVYVWRCIRNC